jgi:hypothetical protein
MWGMLMSPRRVGDARFRALYMVSRRQAVGSSVRAAATVGLPSPLKHSSPV